MAISQLYYKCTAGVHQILSEAGSAFNKRVPEIYYAGDKLYSPYSYRLIIFYLAVFTITAKTSDTKIFIPFGVEDIGVYTSIVTLFHFSVIFGVITHLWVKGGSKLLTNHLIGRTTFAGREALILFLIIIFQTLIFSSYYWLNQNPLKHEPAYEMFSCVFGAPINEELVFRGLFLTILLKYAKTSKAVLIALFLNTLIFWQVHTYSSLRASSYIFIEGLILGYLFLRTGSVVMCMIAHSSANMIGHTILPRLIINYFPH